MKNQKKTQDVRVMIFIPLEDIIYFLEFQMGFRMLFPSTVCDSSLFDFLEGVQELRNRDLTRAPHTVVIHCKERNRSINSTDMEVGLNVGSLKKCSFQVIAVVYGML